MCYDDFFKIPVKTDIRRKDGKTERLKDGVFFEL